MTVRVHKVESRGPDGIVLHARGRFGTVVEVEIGVAEAAELMRALLRAFGAAALKSFLGIK